MTIGPVKVSPFGPLAAVGTRIQSMYGEDDTKTSQGLKALGRANGLSTGPGHIDSGRPGKPTRR